MKRFFSQKTTLAGLSLIATGIIHGATSGDWQSAAVTIIQGIAVIAGREAINKATKKKDSTP